MKRILIFVLFIFISCEDKKDTTPPEATIISPTASSTVNEVVNVTCMSTDNKGVEKVELWVDGVNTSLTDNTEPYSFQWNTTTYTDGNHTLVVRAYDTNGNEGDSAPITVKVDNTVSVPNSISVKSADFSSGGFTIEWSKSTDGDFKSYTLEHSVEPQMNDYENIFTTQDVKVTTTRMENTSPLSYHYFRVTVTDTFLYQTKGAIFTSKLDPIPDSVDVKSVTYDLEKMTVEWDKSNISDFGHYKLLYSKTEDAVDKESIEKISDINTTAYSISTFDPTHENWYWVVVADTLSQSKIGNGKTNTIDSPPTTPVLNMIDYDPTNSQLKLTWEKNNDDDFHSYKIFESESEDMSNQIEKFTTDDNSVINFNLSREKDLIRYYRLQITDKWGLTSLSDIQIGDSNNWFFVTHGKNHKSDFGYDAQQTSDSGYVVVGYTRSFSSDQAIYLVRFNMRGKFLWESFFPGNYESEGHSVQQTLDGGYIITGFSEASNRRQIALIKADETGKEVWSKTFGELDEHDIGFSVQQTSDGGYIITGETNSFGSLSMWLIKTDSNGNEEWNKTFSEEYSWGSTSYGWDVQQTTDGGYIITGSVKGNIEHLNTNNGSRYYLWLMKTDSNGNEEWKSKFSGYSNDGIGNAYGRSVKQTSDGGYIITGNVSTQENQEELWLIKTDSQGKEEWNKLFGGSYDDYGYSVQQTTDYGFIIVGTTRSFENNKSHIWLIKTNSNGTEEWSKVIGRGQGDYGRSVNQTFDGGYFIGGTTWSASQGDDLLIIKTNAAGETAKYK